MHETFMTKDKMMQTFSCHLYDHINYVLKWLEQ
jgi:hypothetical protein